MNLIATRNTNVSDAYEKPWLLLHIVPQFEVSPIPVNRNMSLIHSYVVLFKVLQDYCYIFPTCN